MAQEPTHEALIVKMTDLLSDNIDLGTAAHAYAAAAVGIEPASDTQAAREAAYYAHYSLFQFDVLAKVMARMTKLG